MKFEFAKSFFTSNEHYRTESQIFWKSNWFFAGTDHELKEKGDYFRISLFGEDLIVILGEEEIVYCHRNNCTHRNSKIFNDKKGNSRLICQYHGGAYKYNGRYISRFLCKDLYSFRVSRIGHFIFISSKECNIALNDFLMGFDDDLLNISNYLDSNLLNDKSINHKANWKLLVENVLEGFHCPTVHSESLLIDGICSVPFNDFKQSKNHLHSSWDYPSEMTPFKLKKEKRFSFIKNYSDSFRAFRHIYIFPNLLISSTENYFIYVGILSPESSRSTNLIVNFFRTSFDPEIINSTRFKGFYEAACNSGLKVIVEEDLPMIQNCFDNILTSINDAIEYNLNPNNENRLICFYKKFIENEQYFNNGS